jgi:hypothetical protein
MSTCDLPEAKEPITSLLKSPLLLINGDWGVVRARIEGVFPTYKTLKDGSRRKYWYHRATGRRLQGEPGLPEFISDYAAAEKLIRDRYTGTVNSLIRSYTLSVEFEEKLAPSTQAEYKRMLTKAETEFGNMPLCCTRRSARQARFPRLA